MSTKSVTNSPSQPEASPALNMGSHDVTGRTSLQNEDAMRSGGNAGTGPRLTGPSLLRTYNSQELFAGANEIGIEHDGQIYRLKITRQGKLILNK